MSLEKPDMFDKMVGRAWSDSNGQPNENSIGHNQTYLIWCIKRYLLIMIHSIIWIPIIICGCMLMAALEYAVFGTSPSFNGLIVAILLFAVPLMMAGELCIMELDVRHTFGTPLPGKDKKEGVDK